MPYLVMTPAPGAEGEKALATVQRVNQRWIVHGKLRENAAAYLAHLEKTDPVRLQRACELALLLVRHKKDVLLRDPKPLFYSGLFAFATKEEINRHLRDHPMTRAISLLLHHDGSGLDPLSGSAVNLAESIAGEIQAVAGFGLGRLGETDGDCASLDRHAQWNPLRGSYLLAAFPRVAAPSSRQPWAIGWNGVAVLRGRQALASTSASS